MIDVIKKIIEYGIHAPSGDNCQPWRFVIKDNDIYIYNLPARDNSLYSWGQRASFVAHGALIENMVIIASVLGYILRIKLFPDTLDSELVAYVQLEKSRTKDEPLCRYILTRSTNRRPYISEFLSVEQRDNLLKTPQEVGGGEVLLVEDPHKKKILARSASTNEEILFENFYLHNFFYRHINWTERADKENSIGFYIKTFELSLPAIGAFWLAKHWYLLKLLNKINFSKFVAKLNAEVYASAAAFGVVIVNNNTPQDFVVAGRLMQRVWLKVTQMGLSLQPLTGVLFLMLKIGVGETEEMSIKHIKLVKSTYNVIRKTFDVREGTIAMMFRIGKSRQPSARALRLPMDVRIEK